MINSYHFWKMVAIITPIIAAIIIGFAGYKMYRLKAKDVDQNQTELLKSHEKIKNEIMENQSKESNKKDIPSVKEETINDNSINISDTKGVVQVAVNSPNAQQIGGDLIINENTPRIISPETINKMLPALKASPKYKMEITVSLGDSESYELGLQIKKILENAGWEVTKINPAIVEPPLKRGFSLWFGEKPSGATQAVFGPIFEQFQYEKRVDLDKTRYKGKIHLKIGSK